MKKKMSMGLIAALALLLLLAGAALAASQLGLFDFLQGRFSKEIPMDAKVAMEQNALTQTYDMGVVTVAFNEVIADGHWFYFTALVTPKDPEKTWIIPDYSGVDEPAHAYDAKWDGKDRRTYTEFAKEEGMQLVQTSVWVDFGGEGEQMFDNIRQSDGTMLYVTGGDLVTTAPTKDVTIHLRASLMDNEGNIVEGSQKEQFIPLTVTVTTAAEEKVYPGEGKAIPSTKIGIDKVTLTKTALAVYQHVDYQMKDGAEVPADLDFNFLDEASNSIDLGTTLSGDSLDMTELPEEVTLQAYFYDSGERSAPLTLKAEGQ